MDIQINIENEHQNRESRDDGWSNVHEPVNHTKFTKFRTRSSSRVEHFNQSKVIL